MISRRIAMKKKTTRSSYEQNQWSLPKWGTPIVERWFNDCLGETKHLTHAQAQREVIENATDHRHAMGNGYTPQRQFEEIVEDFETNMKRLE